MRNWGAAFGAIAKRFFQLWPAFVAEKTTWTQSSNVKSVPAKTSLVLSPAVSMGGWDGSRFVQKWLKYIFVLGNIFFVQKIYFCTGSLLRVSVRRQVACYVIERRTGGNTTDKFNFTRSVCCKPYKTPWFVHNTHWYTRPTGLIFWTGFTSLIEYTHHFFLSLSYLSLSHIQTSLTYIMFSHFSGKFWKYQYLETLHHTYAVLRSFITIAKCKQLNVLECSRILHYG